MKTPIETMIDFVIETNKNDKNTFKDYYYHLMAELDRLLYIEEELFKETFDKGYGDGYHDNGRDGKQFFDEFFNENSNTDTTDNSDLPF